MLNNRILLVSVLVVVLAVSVLSFVILKRTPKEPVLAIKLDKAEMIHKRAEDYLQSGETSKAENAFLVLIGQYPYSPYAESSLRELAAIHVKLGNYDKAAYYYKRLLNDFPGVKDAGEIRASIEELNMKHMASSVRSEDSIVYEVRSGDSLYSIAKKFNTTVALTKRVNDLKSDIIRVGQKLKIVVAKFSIHVDKAKNILVLKKDGSPFKTYKVATGENNSTPVGKFTIVDKMVRPPWTKPGVGVVMPDQEAYELGERWMPISMAGYGIHGTNDESSIGKQTTAGCIRMRNEDVIELYDIVPAGTEVEITDGTVAASAEAPASPAGQQSAAVIAQ